jgi:cyclohexadieny/prephenate dehydrogenase
MAGGKGEMTLSIAVLGLGLMGGSVALAARRRGLVSTVAGWDPSASACAKALATGVVDRLELDPGDAVSGADLVILGCPVSEVVPLARQIGSTKGSIMQELAAGLPGGACFVGSHPLAGSEKSGCAHADAALFENRTVVVCRGDATNEAVERVTMLWQGLGARVVSMEPEEHDRALAVTSHLPHLLAYLLAGQPKGVERSLVASGFRDCTRVAASDPALWAGIFRDNREALLVAVDLYLSKLVAARTLLANGAVLGEIRELIEPGHQFRSDLFSG